MDAILVRVVTLRGDCNSGIELMEYKVSYNQAEGTTRYTFKLN